MRKIRTKLNSLKKQSEQDIKGVVVYFLFLTALGTTVYAMRLYDVTIIGDRTLYTVSAFGSLICLLALKLTQAEKNKFIWTLLVSVGIGGGYFYSVTLILNHAFANKEIFRKDFVILDIGETAKGRYRKCYPPYATIEFEGLKKRIVFGCDDKMKIGNSSKVLLEYSTGLLGYAVIKSSVLN